VLIRPIIPGDGPALEAFHASLSDRTTYLRFFRTHPALTADEVHHFTHVDYRDRLALVVEDEGRLVAVARYDRTGPDEAEVAFVVADAYQHRGLGHELLARLGPPARQVGISRFTAEVLEENSAMLRVFHHGPYPTTTRTGGGTAHLVMAITPLPPG
jgi:RimJ/RimL family protein N-acetyltransferase